MKRAHFEDHRGRLLGTVTVPEFRETIHLPYQEVCWPPHPTIMPIGIEVPKASVRTRVFHLVCVVQCDGYYREELCAGDRP